MNKTKEKSIAAIDQEIIWHPYTQMKTAGLPIAVKSAKEAVLFTEDGAEFIDAISSWWVTLHGHSNPYLAQKIFEQLQTLDHVIFAGFTHPAAVTLGQRLLTHLPSNQSRLFFTDNGSTAIEVGLKMAIQYFQNIGKPRGKIIALEDAYHGDTFGAMSVGGSQFFQGPFGDYLFSVSTIPTPVKGKEEESVNALKKILEEEEVAVFIFEPLVQGAGGMQMYSPEILDQLIGLCQEKGVLCLADEVMTGFGRTGKFFASDYLQNQPDILAFSKGLTGGTLPMAITSCTDEIFQAFYSTDKTKTLYHGHSYTGNPVGCAAALASLDLLEETATWDKIANIARLHEAFSPKIADHPMVKEVRQRGTILAIELKTSDGSSYFSGIRDQLNSFFIKENVLLRPLGYIVYILPPYCISAEQLERVYEVIELAIQEVYESA